MGPARVDAKLIGEIREGLRAAADPARAPKMQAYMKSTMPYLGVPVPQVRALVRRGSVAHPPPDTAALAATAGRLWRSAEFREERYAATELTNTPAARLQQTPALLPLYEEIIVTGAWWDHVDETAHRIGALLLSYPSEVAPLVRGWQQSPDRWLRRTSIVCQLGARRQTDLELLSSAIEANAGDPDFFVRKGIGWALRDYARTDPDWVRGFVERHAATLSPLSRREALKRLTP